MAREFNGTTQYLAHNAAPVTAVPLTMACWFNSDSATAQQFLMAIADYGGGAGGDFHALIAQGAAVGDPVAAASFVTSTTTAYATSSGGYSVGQWHHAAGVWANNASRTAYLDGVGGTPNTVSKAVAGLTRTGIGALYRSDNPAVYTDGRIAEAALWDVALSDAEVGILAKGFSPLLVRPQSLVAYWPLIGRYSPEIDVVGGYGLTLVNGPATADHPRVVGAG